MEDESAVSFDENDFLQLGFEVRGFLGYGKIKVATQKEYFRSLYGTFPGILASIWQDLRHSDIRDCKLDKNAKPIDLLLYYRWKRSYETEFELRTQFNIGEETLRKRIRSMAKKVAGLRATMVSFLLAMIIMMLSLLFSPFVRLILIGKTTMAKNKNYLEYYCLFENYL